MPHSATRTHEFQAGHRVFGHEGKCAHLHGHSYVVSFTITSDNERLDGVSRVMDFSAIKVLCNWLDEHWDHRTLISEGDPMLAKLREADSFGVVAVPFNPTAEAIAEYLVRIVGPQLLRGTGCSLKMCKVEETRKCSATYWL